ncbi:MAG TPA: hemerythrin domain-containing protein [Dongiaceae bacterium]
MPTAAKHSSTSARKRRTTHASGKNDAVKLLKADHKEVSDMVAKYQNGRLTKDRKMALARQICLALTVHAQIEEEIFYPAAREEARNGEDLLDEAEVEHGSIKELVAAVENGSPDDDDLFDARVKVLGEYVKHHVKEEEGELFPKVRKSDMDLEEIGARLAARKKALMRELKGDA